jgi:hypothetical protein
MSWILLLLLACFGAGFVTGVASTLALAHFDVEMPEPE